MRVFEVWKDALTAFYYWRLIDERGHCICASQSGEASAEGCEAAIRRLAIDFAHTRLMFISLTAAS